MKTISPSELNTFLRCPAQWHYKQIGVGTVPVPETARNIGIAVHAIIDTYLGSLQADVDKNAILSGLSKAEEVTRGARLVSGREKFRTCMENLKDYELRRLRTWERFLPTFTEHRLELQLDDVDGVNKLTGKIDFYGNNTIIDWKTSTFTKMTDERIRQGTMYEMLAEHHGYTVNKVLFVFLPSGKVKVTPKESFSWVRMNIRRMLDMIDGRDFPNRPTPLCNYCEYRFACKYNNNGIFNNPPQLGHGPLFIRPEMKKGDVISERKEKEFVDDDSFFE